MATDEKWYFTKEQLANTPSRKCGIDADKELSYRQQAANFIQDMGQRLVVTQLCINTAIVYMHRFYVFHSLSQFHRNSIAAAALFLAAKVEEQPRKLEHVIKVAHICLHRDSNPPDIKSEAYLEQAQDLVFNENVLLQTLGFDVAIDHPHTHVVRCCHLVKASKDLAQTSYFMASNSLHLTTMCLQYKPTVVACFCIHLACKWSNWEIPQSNEGKSWFWYVDRTVTAELLQQLTAEFLHIFDKCPSRLKKKIMSISEKQSPSIHHPSLPNSPFDAEPRKVQSPATDSGPTFQSARPFPTDDDKKINKSSSNLQQSRPPLVDYREYREKKERERLEREKMMTSSGGNSSTSSSSSSQSHSQDLKHHSHHHKQPSSSSTSSLSGVSTSTTTTSSKNLPIPPNQKPNIHHNHHHRPDIKLQSSSQRHSSSSSSQQRDLNRQQRVSSRDYNSGQSQQNVNYAHNHPGSHSSKDASNLVGDNNTTSGGAGAGAAGDMLPVLTDANQSTHQNVVAEKVTNNHHNVHRLVAHDKRFYDSRHKMMDSGRKDTDSQQKNYPKYGAEQQTRGGNDNKSKKSTDSLEQRSEEVRKLIEKPLPIPKPRAEVQKEEYIASMLKQSHHPAPNKYNVDKPVSSNNSRNVFPPKPYVIVKQQAPTSHNVTQILKDTKNGTSANVNCSNAADNSDNKLLKQEVDVKLRVKQEHQSDQSVPPPPPPPVRHKSIFSPVKIPSNNSDSMPSSNRSKGTKQKTPPMSVKAGTIKQERYPVVDPVVTQDLNLISPFSSPPDTLTIPHSTSSTLNSSNSNNKRNHMSHLNDSIAPIVKCKTDDTSVLDNTKQLISNQTRLPELIQPISEYPELTESTFNQDLTSGKNILTNGLDNIINPNLQNDNNDLLLDTQQIKNEYLSPLKSAQSISALLQEPLAPMPSLLQGSTSPDSGTFSQASSYVHHSSSQSNQSVVHHETTESQTAVMVNNVEQHIDDAFVLSTVDISALSAPIQTVPEVPITTSATTPVVIATTQPQTDNPKQKSEHHKSEKKKKKDKHKHKDKDKSKEKHKHKHKDKDKEKHRDKDKDKERSKDKDRDKDSNKERDDNSSTAPIKITIPKDKLNLSSDSGLTQDKKSPQSTGLKIKIPKERLKGTETSSSSSSSSSVAPVLRENQAPLKIKIRTNPAITQDFNTDNSNRKRERETTSDSSSASSAPPSKKIQLTNQVSQSSTQLQSQQLIQQQQQQQNKQQHQHQHQQHGRPNERQNGRHYNSSSNNKEKHSSREHKSSSKLSQSQQSHST